MTDDEYLKLVDSVGELRAMHIYMDLHQCPFYAAQDAIIRARGWRLVHDIECGCAQWYDLKTGNPIDLNHYAPNCKRKLDPRTS